MKRLKKWFFLFLCSFVIILCILGVFVLNPSLLYGHKTKFENITVYHEKPLSGATATIIQNARMLLRKSELYDSAFAIDVCLNDGSTYPRFIQALHKPAFGIGFYNKVIIMGYIHMDENYTALNGYKWNLTQLLTHEAIHCYQFAKLGLWKSNPFAGYPTWKWEGYNEYVARQDTSQVDLTKNISRLLETEKVNSETWAIIFPDGTIAGKLYYKWWLEMQFCKDVKGMSYQVILKDTTSEESIHSEMMRWYEQRQLQN